MALGAGGAKLGSFRSAPVIGVFAHVFVGEIATDDDRAGGTVADFDFDFDAALMRRIIDGRGEDAVFWRRTRVKFCAAKVGDEGRVFLGIQFENSA